MQSEPCGVLVVNKHSGVTSHDIVYKIRKLFNTRRVGHTGTLDPMATGVLVVLIGRAAKAAEYLACDTKEYKATMRLGLESDTEDVTGEVLARCDEIPDSESVISCCKSFVGRIKQIPPMYSALKVGGKKLCDLARDGVTVERQAREIEIFSLECIPTESKTDYTLQVKCSSGTYIRTLCADIGKALGCGAVMASLERAAVADFRIEDALSICELEQMEQSVREAKLLPIESLFAELQRVELPAFYEKLSRNGCEIYQKKIRTDLPVGTKVRMRGCDGRFYALGEVREYVDGSAIKTIKLFDI